MTPMKKMTPTQLKQYVIAEAKKLVKVEMLKEEKAKILGQLKKLNENEISQVNDSKAIVDKAINKMEADPNIPKVAQQIANDPKAMAELQRVLANLGVGVNEGTGINPEQIALAFMKKTTGINENAGAGFWTGLLGGGALAHYIFSVPVVGSVIAGASTAATTETIIGSIIGATLGVLASYIYEKFKKKNFDGGGLDEQWNPDDNYVGEYFTATAPMDEPGEARVHVIGDNQYGEYSEAGWDIEGPYSKEEAEAILEKTQSSNGQWRYYSSNQHDATSDFDLGNLHDFDRGEF